MGRRKVRVAAERRAKPAGIQGIRVRGETMSTDRFLRACRREPVDCTPVWFMRQAGRSLPEYRRVREHHTLLDIARDPELCAEITLLPVATDRKSTRLNSSHIQKSRMPSSA